MCKCFRPLVHGNRLHPQQVAFYAATLNLHPATYRSALPSAALRPAGSICAAMLSLNNATASIRIQLHLLLFTAMCRTPALKGFVCTTLRIARRQSTRNSPHSRPVDQFSSACSRSQMRLSTCPAPHSSPGGLRLCSMCFRPLVQGNRLHPQQVAFYAERLDQHPTPYRSAFPGAALRPSGSICTTYRITRNAIRQSTRSSPHPRPAVPQSHRPAFAVR